MEEEEEAEEFWKRGAPAVADSDGDDNDDDSSDDDDIVVENSCFDWLRAEMALWFRNVAGLPKRPLPLFPVVMETEPKTVSGVEDEEKGAESGEKASLDSASLDCAMGTLGLRPLLLPM